ncbi:MAG: hypothetical protein ACTHNY_03410 [Solirubrobacterales bacterium]
MSDFQQSYWEPEPETPRWALVVAGLILVVGVASAAAIYISRQNDDPPAVARVAPHKADAKEGAEPLPPQPETQTRAITPVPAKQHSTPAGGPMGG